jgi:hypothetical protein
MWVAMDSSTKSQDTIFIPLLDEGTPCWRPTKGVKIGELLYRVLPTDNYDPLDENWAFKPGDIVVCKEERKDAETVLIAYRIVNLANGCA